jgi:hypothetical protein
MIHKSLNETDDGVDGVDDEGGACPLWSGRLASIRGWKSLILSLPMESKADTAPLRERPGAQPSLCAAQAPRAWRRSGSRVGCAAFLSLRLQRPLDQNDPVFKKRSRSAGRMAFGGKVRGLGCSVEVASEISFQA